MASQEQQEPDTCPAPPGDGGTYRENGKYPDVDMVLATEMTLGEYLKRRNWRRFDDEDPDSKGFFVEWVGWGPSHQKGHDSYTSWVPEWKFLRDFDVVPQVKH